MKLAFAAPTHPLLQVSSLRFSPLLSFPGIDFLFLRYGQRSFQKQKKRLPWCIKENDNQILLGLADSFNAAQNVLQQSVMDSYTTAKKQILKSHELVAAVNRRVLM